MKKLLLVSLLSTAAIGLGAQTPQSYCGTLQTESDLAWLRSFQANHVPGEESRGGTTYYIPTKVHIVGTDEGSGYYNLNYLYQAFCELNEHFEATGFIFYIKDDINYIDNSDYYEHNFLDGGEMMEDYNVNDMLNVYFVSDPAGNCGYFSPGEDGVAVAKSCAMPDGTTIAHEFGHFFSLPHTFYGWEWGTPDEEDQEWVNGDNCNSAADGFCDTPPDYLPYRWFCPGPLQTDPFGETFYSDGTFYMSYSNDACTDKFSDDQQDAMIANLLGPRNDFLDWPDPVYVDLTDPISLISPVDLTEGLYFNYVNLEWTPVTGASEYHVQIAFSPSFSAIAKDIIADGSSVLVTDLAPDKKYYWRVRPLAPANTCEATSTAWSFNTGSVEWNDVITTNLFETLAVYPNPAITGSNITISYTTDNAADAMVSLIDMTGKVISSASLPVVPGAQTFEMAIPAVSEGMYMVRIHAGNATETISLFIAQQ